MGHGNVSQPALDSAGTMSSTHFLLPDLFFFCTNNCPISCPESWVKQIYSVRITINPVTTSSHLPSLVVRDTDRAEYTTSFVLLTTGLTFYIKVSVL